MKKYIFRLFGALLAMAIITSCSEEQGTIPGNDSNPAITVYQYNASKPFNVDNDVVIRFATNNQTTEAYYLVEKTIDKDARTASIGRYAYMDYVIANGTKIDGISGESVAEVTLTDLLGSYTVTAVAVNGSAKTSGSTVFAGLDWKTVTTGTYRFYYPTITGKASIPTTLQVCTTNDRLYRFKDVFGTGYHMKINLLDLTGSDDNNKISGHSGIYTFFRILETPTSFTYGDAGNAVSVRDIGYWQKNDAWVTEYGLESGMFEDYTCFICIQYFTEAGSIAYTGYDGMNDYDEFIPD
ncbi:MAG: hypothetical protein LBP63_01595 [Prevotellaceae bacterium]|jgi:hypothetical protein|nr:hypothetical protein [Prevotellaceae bacterium]